MACGVFVGLSTVDLIYTVDDFPRANAKSVATSQQVLVGGPATNAAITFSHLGGNATLVAAVGRHALSVLIRDEIQRHSVTLVDLSPESDEPPAISSVWVNRHGQRSIVSMNATRFKAPAPDIEKFIIENAAIMLVDAHSIEACQAWANAAHARGVPVVLDGGSWKPGMDQLLDSVDTAVCSADFRPPGCTSEDAVIEYLRASGVRQIAITRGADPVRFVAGTSAGLVEVPQVDVVDTAGAGDIFHGAFCYYASAGCDFAVALRDAARIAAKSCRFRGTREWMSLG